MLALLRSNADVRSLFIAQVVSYMGDWFAYVAFVGLVQGLVDSPLLVTLVYVADTICCQSKHGFNLTAMHQRLDELELRDVQLDSTLVMRTAANLDELVKVASTLLG
jgi:hypothetical protein